MNSATILVLFATFLYHTAVVTGQYPNIWQTISTDDRLKTLTAALKAAGLEETIQQAGSITVFAPTDTAFSEVPSETVQYFSDPGNKDELAKFLAYHAVGDKVLTSAELIKMNLPARLETLAGDFITVSKQDDQVKINNATVVEPDIMVSNGVVHLIDGILMSTPSSK